MKLQFKIWGKSMQPLFKGDGEVVELELVKNIQEIKRFDIIIFWQGNNLLIHYFWKLNKHFNNSLKDFCIVTRPLNPIERFDHPIRFEQILGRVKKEKMSLLLKLKVLLNS